MTFRSKLDDDELWVRVEARMPRFRDLPGLVQKDDVTDPTTSEVGGVTLFESGKELDDDLASDLRATIGGAFAVEGEPAVRRFRVEKTLRPTM